MDPTPNNPTDIDDIRLISDFKGATFSGFKKTEVRNQMLRAMIQGRIEQACYWSAELICAGQFLDTWENIFHFMSKHVHLGNPKMAIYVAARFKVFRNIMLDASTSRELDMRNNHELRKLFAEVICNLTLSPRKPSFEAIKILRQEEFDMTQMSDRLKAPSTEYACAAFRPKDPKELFIAVNEFAFQLASNNMSMCCYWIEWMIEFDAVCRFRQQLVKCDPRDFVDERKYKGDIIWLLWDAILLSSRARAEPFVLRVIASLLEIFCVKYTTACAKKRRYIIYMAVELLTETVATATDIVSDRHILINVVEQIDSVYRQIKKNEQRGGMDYLFNN
jgi:hypothetical protein